LIRSRIKDRTIDQLKRDLEDQYYRQDNNEEVIRLKRELEDAQNAITMYDSTNQSNGQLESGEKFQMIQEIRQKSKSLREAEEKVDTLKKREVQIRETCDAWKKEVDIVRAENTEHMTRLKEQNTAAMDNLTKQFAQERSSLRKECDELIAKNAILQRDVETLKTENITLKSQPSQMHHQPSYHQPPPVPPELQPPPGPPPFVSQSIYCYDQPQQHQAQHHSGRGRGRGRGGGGSNNQRGGGRGGSQGGKSWPGNQTTSPQQRLGVNFNQTPTLGMSLPSPSVQPNTNQQQSFNTGQNNQKKPPNITQGAGIPKARKYSDAQQEKRREKLLDRLLEKSKQTGIPFVPEPGGPLEILYKAKIASGHYPAPPPAVSAAMNVPPPPTPSADNTNWSSDTIVIS